MLQLSASLLNKPVLSLRTGGKVALTGKPIFNPNNLKIEGFYCTDLVNKGTLVLLTQDIREIISQGLIVNDYESLTDPEELVRLQDILKLGFNVMGRHVITENKQRLGKVVDYAADSQTLYIQKLYVVQSILKSLSNAQLGIDRSQIIEITNKHIIVQEPLQPTRASVATNPSTV